MPGLRVGVASPCGGGLPHLPRATSTIRTASGGSGGSGHSQTACHACVARASRSWRGRPASRVCAPTQPAERSAPWRPSSSVHARALGRGYANGGAAADAPFHAASATTYGAATRLRSAVLTAELCGATLRGGAAYNADLRAAASGGICSHGRSASS